jgi:hypothetical protein
MEGAIRMFGGHGRGAYTIATLSLGNIYRVPSAKPEERKRSSMISAVARRRGPDHDIYPGNCTAGAGTSASASLL